MRLLEASLTGEARAGEVSAFDAADEFEAEEFVQVLKVHRAKLIGPEGMTVQRLRWVPGCERLCGRRFLRETISFDKTKIRRNFYFVQ